MLWILVLPSYSWFVHILHNLLLTLNPPWIRIWIWAWVLFRVFFFDALYMFNSLLNNTHLSFIVVVWTLLFALLQAESMSTNWHRIVAIAIVYRVFGSIVYGRQKDFPLDTVWNCDLLFLNVVLVEVVVGEEIAADTFIRNYIIFTNLKLFKIELVHVLTFKSMILNAENLSFIVRLVVILTPGVNIVLNPHIWLVVLHTNYNNIISWSKHWLKCHKN